MDPTSRFFSKLKKLAVTLETETAKLQDKFENRKEEADSETTARAMRAYHELNCDVGNFKGQIQEQLAQQKEKETEVDSFIKACRVMQERVTGDIHTLKGHWEKYGYQGRRNANPPTGRDSDVEDEEGDENEEEAAGDQDSSTPKSGPAPVTDVTPKLSDYGLSEFQLKRTMAGFSEVPPMPEMRLPLPSLATPTPPTPPTPKRALRMTDEELMTPQMHHFGISEHTMCLNNDFTMDLFRKNAEKPQRQPQNMPEPPAIASAYTLESPEPPVLCTPGFKIKKTNAQSSTSAEGNSDPQSPCGAADMPSTPTFQTPYLNRMFSTKKSTRKLEAMNKQTFDIPTDPAENGDTVPKRTWGDAALDNYNMDQDEQMPEMPVLESILGNSLGSKQAKLQKNGEDEKVTKESTVRSLELDGPTQQFSLRMPHIRTHYEEPGTPEMPDLSSVTQDICKLLSTAQSKKSPAPRALVRPNVRPAKVQNRAASLCAVSESEFQSLPGYLRQMTVSNLNQAIHNINEFAADSSGDNMELSMEELRRIANVGTKTPIYILCLTELKRLTHMGGTRDTSAYKLNTHS